MLRFAAVVALIALLVAACSSNSPNPAQTVTVTVTASAPGSTPTPTEANAVDETGAPPTDATSEAESAGNPVFGDTWTWEDNLSVLVGQPRRFTPSDTAAAEKAPAYVRFRIKIMNNTGDTYDPVLFTVTLQSGDTESDQVFDSATGLNGTPTTKLLNGRQVVFYVGFGVKTPNDLVLEVSPGFEYESALFTSK